MIDLDDAASKLPWLRLGLLAPFVPAVTTKLRENCRLEIRIMSLGGGAATSERHLSPGTVPAPKLRACAALRAQAMVRNARKPSLRGG